MRGCARPPDGPPSAPQPQDICLNASPCPACSLPGGTPHTTQSSHPAPSRSPGSSADLGCSAPASPRLPLPCPGPLPATLRAAMSPPHRTPPGPTPDGPPALSLSRHLVSRLPQPYPPWCSHVCCLSPTAGEHPRSRGSVLISEPSKVPGMQQALPKCCMNGLAQLHSWEVAPLEPSPGSPGLLPPATGPDVTKISRRSLRSPPRWALRGLGPRLHGHTVGSCVGQWACGGH